VGMSDLWNGASTMSGGLLYFSGFEISISASREPIIIAIQKPQTGMSPLLILTNAFRAERWK
jgi:hypothetical protein